MTKNGQIKCAKNDKNDIFGQKWPKNEPFLSFLAIFDKKVQKMHFFKKHILPVTSDFLSQNALKKVQILHENRATVITVLDNFSNIFDPSTSPPKWH